MRASELCELMPDTRTVQLAIKYASRLHLMQLAERLGNVAQLKADEEQRVENERNLVRCCLSHFMNYFLPAVVAVLQHFHWHHNGVVQWHTAIKSVVTQCCYAVWMITSCYAAEIGRD